MIETWEQLGKLQPLVRKMLKQFIKKERLAHAYLFEGEKGTGKMETGLLLAKTLFCQSSGDTIPCGVCPNCQRISNRNHPDFHIVEPDGASIKKEQILLLQQEFAKKGVESKRKFYITRHADKMTASAANSLLKFLEEPHEGTIALLITENMNQMLPTILSRCQIIKFYPLPKEEMIRLLIERGIKPERAPFLAHITNNVEEALSLAQDEWFLQAQKLVLKLSEIVTTDHLADALLYLQTDWLPHFKERQQIDIGLDMLLFKYRDLLHLQLGSDDLVYPKQAQDWGSEALRTPTEKIANRIEAILETKKRLDANVNGQLLMEQLVLKLKEGSAFV